ncbi:unannotated protein [freshwater metagenome]|uniref:Unannotated protein n=1 Tax=freshwater metagenome TaxID=449393 RepID=A0A6J7AH63_9ZZZZ
MPPSPPWMPTVRPASAMRAHTGSKVGHAGDKLPSAVGTGPGTMHTMRAPLSIANSTCSTALSTSASDSTGAAKMRFW